MSVPEPEIAEDLTNGIITEEQNTTENNEQILSEEQNYDETQNNDEISLKPIQNDDEISLNQTQNNDEISLNNVDNEAKPEATADHVEEIISNTTEHAQESISTAQTESVEFHRTVTQTEVHGEVIQEIQDQEPLQNIINNATVNEESSEVATEIKEELTSNEEDSKVSTSSKKEDSNSSQIQEESLRNKLHEIIQEISFEVQDENEPRSHTWKPKGKYEVPKTEIKYEEIVPCEVPDVTIQERAKLAEKEKKNAKKQQKKENIESQSEETRQQTFSEETTHQYSIDAQKILRHTVVNGEPLSPQEIPIGIPLLAKILPKDESGDEEPREKITLERLFTPASDAENLIPLKKKRAFASSCFYRPDHPTIDDQVELAHKISTSLIDENNKSSRGQTMYMKRKNRSSKWIHEGGASQSREAWQQETILQEEKSFKGKPQLKLVLSPKKVQDFNAVQKHYEELMATSIESTRHITRMEVGKEIATHLESPTGKGAALFAKRKKRMDKFIVDESTIHQQQQQDQQQQQQNEAVSSQQSNFSSEQNNSFLTSESNSIVQENGFQSNHDISFGALNAADQEGAIYKAEVTLVQKPLSASPALDISAPLPFHKIINEDDFPAKKEDRRKSFNLAPKGWGTYNNFYTPVHLEAK